MTNREVTERVLVAYARAWRASDLDAVLAAYHEDVELHYMGVSPLAGTHRGRDAALTALGHATVRSARRLIDIEDVLIGHELGALVVIEELGMPARRVRRVLLYRVVDERLRECWLFDEDQRFVDTLWSAEM